MGRSSFKAPFVDPSLLKKVRAVLKRYSEVEKAPAITVYSRGSVILPEFNGMLFHVHNGKGFSKVRVQPNMFGFKMGEFAPTRKIPQHKVKKSSSRFSHGS